MGRKERNKTRRQQARKEMEVRRERMNLPRLPAEDLDQEEDDDVFHNDDDIHGAEQGPLEDIPDRFDRDDDFDDMPNPHLGGEVGAVLVEDFGSESGQEGQEESYEELVAKRVAQFVQ